MRLSKHELPAAQEQNLHKAIRCEWITIGFMLSIILVMYFAMGQSQAMKTAWAEDILSLVTPIAFLISVHVARREPNDRFPYGYHRAVSIAFLCGAVALLAFGLLLMFDGVKTLVTREHPTVGAVHLFGHTLWQGWFMFAALAYSAAPPIILGRIKLKLAKELHDKTLFADAEMNKADWETALAAIVGVIGIGVGWWWADAAAAIFISFSIARDGFKTLRTAVSDLMNRRPMSVDDKKVDPLPARVRELLMSYPEVREAAVRMREEGHIYIGEAYVVPNDWELLEGRIEEMVRAARDLHWRIHDLVIMPVITMPVGRATGSTTASAGAIVATSAAE